MRAIPAATTGIVLDATWTPDGTRIAYLNDRRVPSGQRTPPTRVFTIRPDGSANRRVLTLPFDADRGMWATALTWRAQR